MENLIRIKQYLVYVWVFRSLLVILFFTVSHGLAASPPLQNVTISVVPSGFDYILNFSVTDPTRGVISGNSGVIALSSWRVDDGVVSWIYWIRNPNQSLSKVVGFSVYDPKTGVWNTRTTIGIDTDVISNVASDGGTVIWLGFGNIVRFAIFDSELNGWVIGSSSPSTSSAAFVDGTGAVAWQSGNNYFATVYDPTRRSFRIGSTPPLTIPSSYSINNGTLSYTSGGVPATLGYSSSTGGWGSGNTIPRAYFIPSKTTGNVPLTVFFWDMSIGTTGWNYNFGDGGSSSASNPTYSYNSAALSPYTATLSVFGPGGSSSYNRIITPTTPHSISGVASNPNGFKIAGATVNLSGTIPRTTQTDANGNYSFANLTGGGNYTVAISKNRYVFTPPSRTFNNLSGPQTGSFTGKLNNKSSDFDGDGKSDISIFRPSDGNWWILNSGDGSVGGASFGLGTDTITPRDFDGDGRSDIAIWRPSDGYWWIIRSSTGTVTANPFGQNGDIPVANDYDGDEKADHAVFRPSDQNWYILKSSNSQVDILMYGLSTDKPVIGDYDGDSKADLAVFRPSSSTWYFRRSSNGSFGGAQFGDSGDRLVQGDYDGDGKTDFATFRPSDSTWRVSRSSDGVVQSQYWGLNTDVLAPGDFDGDSKHDYAVFRPSSGVWYIITSSGQTLYTSFGLNGDQPTLTSYIGN